MISNLRETILLRFSSITEAMELLEVQDPGEALDVLSIMIRRLLPLAQRLEHSSVTGDATSRETPSE